MKNDSDSKQPYVFGPEDGPAHWFVNNRAIIKASASQTGGQFGLVEMRLGPGHSPPLHIHNGEDESLWVLEGQLTVQCGDVRRKHRCRRGRDGMADLVLSPGKAWLRS